jgi:tetratricopeptide (TPR) repeat protein
VLLMGLAFLAYLPALRGGFVWDDLVLVKQNPLSNGELTLTSIWFQGDFPLSTVLLWIQWLIFGKNAAGYHVVNVALHALNGFLFWRLLERCKVPGARLAACLFVVHPVCVASVAWISELKNTLSLCFALGSILLLMKSDEVDARKQPVWYGLSFFAFVLALFSKTSVVMLPVLLLLFRIARDGCKPRREWLRLAPYFALSLGFGLLTIWFQKHQVIGDSPLPLTGWPERISNAGNALWFYLGKTVLPLDLCMIYPAWTRFVGGASWWIPMALWLGMLALVWLQRRRLGTAWLPLLSFSVVLFPVLGFFNMFFFALAPVSDHLQYAAITCIVAWLAAALKRFLPRAAHLFVANILVLTFGALTFQRAGVFESDESLWRDTLKRNPAAWNAHNNIGCIEAERGDIAGAMKSFEASLRANPENAQAQVNLGRAYAAQGSLELAEKFFRSAQKLRPSDPESYSHYGDALANAGRLPEAIAQIRAATHLRPTVELHLQLAGLYRMTGQVNSSVSQTRAALAMQPDSIEALAGLSWTLASAGDASLRNGKDALALAARGCERTGFRNPRLLIALAAAHAELGDFTNAVERAGQAVAIAQTSGDSQMAALGRQILRTVESGRPVRER